MIAFRLKVPDNGVEVEGTYDPKRKTYELMPEESDVDPQTWVDAITWCKLNVVHGVTREEARQFLTEQGAPPEGL